MKKNRVDHHESGKNAYKGKVFLDATYEATIGPRPWVFLCRGQESNENMGKP